MLTTREYTVYAHDKKAGMTAAELIAALEGVAPTHTPICVTNMAGRIKHIRVKVQVATV